MPRFCANISFMFQEVDFCERFEEARSAGFTAIELLYPYEFSATDLRHHLNDAGLTLVLINAPPGDYVAGERGLACLPDRVSQFRTAIREAIDYATVLDCSLVHVMAGIPPNEVPFSVAEETYIANLNWAADCMKCAGVRMTIEALNPVDMPGYFLATQEQAANIVRQVGLDRLGLQFDIYHCQMSQGNITSRMRQLMPLIAHIQIADVPLRSEPGTGELGWDFIFNEIDMLGYAGWVGCEYRPLADTVAGLSWLSRFTLTASATISS